VKPGTRRWIRLDATWEDSEWLDALDGTAAGCWPRLLCWVKRDGIKGRCKRPTHAVLARRWRVPQEAVAALEAAAIEDGALKIEGGDWVVTGWTEYQDVDPTTNERSKRYRESKSRLSPSRVNHGSHGANGVTLSCATETETVKETPSKRGERNGAAGAAPARSSRRCPAEWQPTDEHRALAIAQGASLEVEVEKFRDHTFRGAKSDWDATFRNWLRRIEVPSNKRNSKANGIHLTASELRSRAGEGSLQAKTRMQVEHERRTGTG